MSDTDKYDDDYDSPHVTMDEHIASVLQADLDAANARADEAERELRIIHLREMPCVCSASYSNTGSTFTRCRRCAEIDELWAAREAVQP